MNDPPSSRADLLLEFHLGILDESQRAWIETELIRDADLRAQSDRLRSTLRPLDFATVPAAPAGLVDKVLEALHRLHAESPRTMRRRSWGRIRTGIGPFVLRRDFLAAAASIALLASVAWPGMAALRDQSRQAACMNNLGSIFQGVRIYQATFADSLPYAGASPGGWLERGDGGPVASNSRHLYLVAKLNYVPDPAQFVCPSMPGGAAMSKEQLARHDDFASARNVSYDALNQAGSRPNLRPAGNIAYVGDANPLFVGGTFHRGVDPYTTNSPAHRGRGQAVLLLDGSVNKLTSPVVDRDNVWIAGDIREYTGTETPTDERDSFLVPGCPTSAGAARRTH